MASKLGQSLLLCCYYARLNHCVSTSAKATWFWMLKTCVHVHVQTLTAAPNLLGLASFPARQVRNSGLKPVLCFLLSELAWDDDAICLCCTPVPFSPVWGQPSILSALLESRWHQSRVAVHLQPWLSLLTRCHPPLSRGKTPTCLQWHDKAVTVT